VNLYHLDRIYDDQWGYDEYDGFVIRAETEHRAREIAVAKSEESWFGDPTKSTCVVLDADGEEGIILASFMAG
jgi:hypothetical protein